MTGDAGGLQRPWLDDGEVRSGPAVAALAMYDLPELQDANDALWSALADRLVAAGVLDVPSRLTRTAPLEQVWLDPRLLLAQTCGYPLVKRLSGTVQVVATPSYTAPGCRGPYYRSAVVVRSHDRAIKVADLRGGRCAVNDLDSNSGMNLLRALVAPLAGRQAFFREVLVTGAHAESVEAVADGFADVAAIDAVTWAHLERLRPHRTSKLRVLDWTPSSPGLPLITSGATERDTRCALASALDDVAREPQLREVRAALLLDGFTALPELAYEAVSGLEAFAVAQGYPRLL